MLGSTPELPFAVHLKITLVVPESGGKRAQTALQQTAGARNFAESLLHSGCNLSGWLFTPGIKVDGNLAATRPSRKLKLELTRGRKTLFAERSAGDFDLVGIIQLQGSHGQAKGMTAKISKRTAAKIIPTAPIDLMILAALVRP